MDRAILIEAWQTNWPKIALTYKEPADITLNGSIKVVAAAQTESEEVKLEELTAECMYDEPARARAHCK